MYTRTYVSEFMVEKDISFDVISEVQNIIGHVLIICMQNANGDGRNW